MKNVLYFLFAVLLLSCGQVSVPDKYEQLKVAPNIYPDYADVTIPVNIAPLNFELMMPASDAVVRFSTDGYELVCSGLKVRPDIDDWRMLTEKAKGKSISVEIFAENNGQWARFLPFNINVSTDSIDLAFVCIIRRADHQPALSGIV